MISIYTLEEHLSVICSKYSDFEPLNSIWTLVKPKLKQALNNVEQNFPQYSLHDATHSQTIIKNIEAFLGKERIETLSPTDTWLILMASFTHDLGMVVFYETIEKHWNSPEFDTFLTNIQENTYDKELKKAAKEIQKLRNTGETTPDHTNALDIRRWVTILNSEYFRKIHAEVSRDILQGKEEYKNFNEVVNKFYSSDVPNRFLILLGDIAYAHGTDFNNILENLEFQANGFLNDKIHPRFIAALLRLGDLLDVDDQRFNPFTEKVFYHQLSEISQHHKDKHGAVKHLQICPRSIEVTVDCPTDEVYRIARDWFDWLEKEVDNQRKHWRLIAPSHLGGLSPIIEDGKIKILKKGGFRKKEFMHLRFQMQQQKIFEILEGGGIYDNPKEVFIRKIIQNAYDASKIQMWKDIQLGTYDFSLKEKLLERGKINDDAIWEKIKFPDDIKKEIQSNYPIKFKVEWANDNEDKIRFSCRDYGIGISDDTLIRMTKYVGQSRKEDREYQELKKTLPYWLRPTGAFGIGLQSIFFATENFTVITKTENELPKKITFSSSKKRNYSSVEEYPYNFRRGTEIIIEINSKDYNLLKKIIEMEDYNLRDKEKTYIESVFLKTKASTTVVQRLLSQIYKQFHHIPTIHFYEADDKLYKPSEATLTSLENSGYDNAALHSINEEELLKEIPYDEENKFKIKIFKSDKKKFGSKYFFIIDERKYGSSITFNFQNLYFREKREFRFNQEKDQTSFKSGYYNNPSDKKKEIVLIRNIPLSTKQEFLPRNFLLGNFIGYFRINLMNEDSDKILDISRSKIISSKKKTIQENILKHIIQPAIPKILNVFQSIEVQDKNEKYDYINNLFYLNWIAILNNSEINSFEGLQKYGSTISKNCILKGLKGDDSFIKYNELNDLSSFWFVSDIYNQEYNSLKKDFSIKDIYDDVKESDQSKNIFSDNDTLIHAKRFMLPYLRKKEFVIQTILYSKRYNCLISNLKKSSSSNSTKEKKSIKLDDNQRKSILRFFYEKNVIKIYPFDKYQSIIISAKKMLINSTTIQNLFFSIQSLFSLITKN